MQRSLALLLAAAATFATTMSGAQPVSGDPAAAQALFEKGVALLKTDDWKGACPQFDASMKLDPSVGAQVNIARCLAHDGSLARAWAAFKQAKVLNRDTASDKRKKEWDSFVDEQIAGLEPRLPWVTVKVSPRPEGLRVERDGAAVPVESLDQRVPIDPGKHKITASAPGYRAAEKSVEMAEGQTLEIALVLELDPNAKPPSLPPPVPPIAPPVVTGPPSSGGTAPLVLAGGIVGGVGALTLVVSAITGGLAYSAKGTVDELVDGPDCDLTVTGELSCNAAAKQEAHDAITRGEPLALASTITLFVGGAIAATGLTCVIIGATRGKQPGSKAALAPLLLPKGGGVVFGGTL